MDFEKKFLMFYNTICLDVVKKRRKLPGEFEQRILRKMCELIGCTVTEAKRKGSHNLICFHPVLKELNLREFQNGVFDIPQSHSKGSKSKPMVDKSVLIRVCTAIHLIKEGLEENAAY